ncbi:uncharacterized protein BT62DRAFT_897210 [Guyanagaster necrorhizus]|uniref:Uncharacterized protein n=1 Tax=Guyanagaster necrorhizus TaxID=856835 RepID=A0A9P7VPU2_9AGAR|nr:uncharacterized protein BT62DRAFT_897210 [Guyanagaster necrorhizus MCA 3950]KAG7445183.1 hypothetical protein BT62DRAFT_897210 [Guyanagaster necrorhizus MCA 3950]
MHMDLSLQVLHSVMTLLEIQLQSFSQSVCTNIHMRELSSETAAQVQKLIHTVKSMAPGVFKSIKSFNLHTYKTHAFGNYIQCIPKFGTSDSYST